MAGEVVTSTGAEMLPLIVGAIEDQSDDLDEVEEITEIELVEDQDKFEPSK